ncbi:MAG: IclR family transcriptional regulator C-terminal domain-containing protein, partial [Caldilineaceae bacterium]
CVHYIDQITTSHVIQVRNWTGERFPLHTTSSGKVFLAFAPRAEVDRYLDEPLIAFTPRTVVEPDALRAQLAAIRARGYDWSVEEFTDGLAVISAPIFGSDARPVASIYVCGPVFRFPAEDEGRALVDALLHACANVSQLLGRATVRDGRSAIPALAG